MADEQNVRIVTSNGDLATTSYGPRTTNKNAPAVRPMSTYKRTVVLQLDGDVETDYLQADADFDNDTRFALPKGCLITDAFVYGVTGIAALNVGSFDVDANGSDTNIAAAAAVGAGAWVAVRDVDISIGAKSHIGFSGLLAGEKAIVHISYLQAVEPGTDGVLAKAQ